MPFWSSQTLEARLKELVDPPNEDLVDCNAVTLRVGREVYITPGFEQPNPNSHTKQLLSEGAPFAIPPGQFAFLLTEEVVTVPPEAMGRRAGVQKPAHKETNAPQHGGLSGNAGL
jgi:dCTP deaminase